MVFQCSNICSFFPDASAPPVFCIDCGRGFAAQIRLISHRQVKHKDKTLRQTSRQTDVVLHCDCFFLTCILQAYEVSDLIPRTQATATHWPEVLKHLTRGSPKYQNTSPGDYKTLRLMSLEIWRYWSNREVLILFSCCHLFCKMMLSSTLTNHFTFL